MNILFIISSLKHGGAEKQTIIDANLFSDDHNVTLITFQSGELKEVLNEKVELITLKKSGYLETAKEVNRIIIEKEIKVINASLFAAMIIAILSAKKANIPVIWYFHSHEYDLQLKSKIAFKYFSKKDCLKKIFFVSEELRKFFVKNGYNFPINKQGVLYNTYTMDINNETAKSINSEIKIGYIGRLVELKRVEYLIETAKYLKKNNVSNFSIDIIGDGISRNKLIDYAKNLKVNDKINFLGFQSDVEKYYNKMDIFALPSNEECLSIALIDAGVKAIPCIAFNVGGNDEIILNNKSGFLVKNKEEFFEKIKLLICDDNRRKEMGINAKYYCIKKFDRKNRYDTLENIFRKLNKTD